MEAAEQRDECFWRVGGEVFRHDAASLAAPLVFMSIDFDWTTLGDFFAETGQNAVVSERVRRAIRASPLTTELHDVTLRLLHCLRSPGEARVLGPAIVRELFYRVLLEEQGNMLRAAAALQGGFARVGRALRLLHLDEFRRLFGHSPSADAKTAFWSGFRCKRHRKSTEWVRIRRRSASQNG